MVDWERRWQERKPDKQKSSSDQVTAPGWYPDPRSPVLRWWNGDAWTEDRRPFPPQQTGISTQKIITGVALGILAAFAVIWFIYQANQPSEVECLDQLIDSVESQGTSYVEPACR